MNVPVTQRWREHRSSYRPAGEPINTRLYEVAPIVADGPAKAFVTAHHYSGTYPAARFRFGLYLGDQLQGVAVFSVPCNPKALDLFPCPAAAKVELGRFVLLDQVPANGETWFLARCFEMLRRAGIAGVLSFSDPVARTSSAGAVVFPGHLGTIYRAHNARYLGRGTGRTLRLLPDGRAVSPRALQKIRAGERGWEYAVEQLVRGGAAEPQRGEDLRCWLRSWLPRMTRPLSNPGPLRYAWGLDRRVERQLPAGMTYPTWEDLGLSRPAPRSTA